MKTITLLSSLITLVFLANKVQAQEESLILTYKENSKWIENLESGNLEGRLKQIKQRIEADKDVYFIVTRNAHGEDKVKQGFGEKSYCRPLYLFTSEGKKPVIFNANPDVELVQKLTDYLKPENISEVEVETGARTTALYGARASCGLISLHLKNEEDLEQLKDWL